MPEPIQIDIPTAQRLILQLMAEAGVVGSTVEEVCAYLITREIDDMMRSGCIKLGGDDA